MLDDPLALLASQPLAIIAAVFLAAALEYVFPPFWGDTVMLVGCFLAGVDRVAAVPVFVAAVAGSCLGATLAYGLGRKFGEASFALVGRSRRAKRFAERAQALYTHHGSRVLAINRFLPGIRAFFLPLAGIGRVPFRGVLLWSTVSNLLYCSVLLTIGLVVGATSDFGAMEGVFRRVSLVTGMVATALLGAILLRGLFRRRAITPAA